MMTPLIVSNADLEPVLAAHHGTRAFTEALEQTATSEDLLRVLGRYIHFNSVFGGCVARLAGSIALEQSLFRDRDDSLEITEDRSTEVAAPVFLAAVDEFGDQSTPARSTHRTLAQATLKAAGEFFGHEPTMLNRIVTINRITHLAIQEICGGYYVPAIGGAWVASPMGFHLGSERLADEEFRILDRYLRTMHPRLVEHLERTHVTSGGNNHPAYHWVATHATVERVHAELALDAVNFALKYCVKSKSDVLSFKDAIIEGFIDFCHVQTGFMEHIADT